LLKLVVKNVPIDLCDRSENALFEKKDTLPLVSFHFQVEIVHG